MNNDSNIDTKKFNIYTKNSILIILYHQLLNIINNRDFFKVFV